MGIFCPPLCAKVKIGSRILTIFDEGRHRGADSERGQPVARFVPISSIKATGESMTRMEKQGLIKLGSKDFWTLPRPVDPRGYILKALLQEREEGR